MLYNKILAIALFDAYIIGSEHLLESIVPVFCYIGNKWLSIVSNHFETFETLYNKGCS